jgi:hypothetical protein
MYAKIIHQNKGEMSQHAKKHIYSESRKSTWIDGPKSGQTDLKCVQSTVHQSKGPHVSLRTRSVVNGGVPGSAKPGVYPSPPSSTWCPPALLIAVMPDSQTKTDLSNCH